MKQRSFEQGRETAWTGFAAQLLTAKRGYRLSNVDSEEFAAQYQRVARDLSVAKSRGYSPRLIRYLNSLVVRGHNLIYVRRSGYGSAILQFLIAGFPRQVRAAWVYVGVSALLFFVPLVVMTGVIFQAPEWVYSVMSAEQASDLEAMYDPASRSLGRQRESDADFQMFGFYIMNNIGISFQLFASGLLAGLGSAFFLVFNGIHIGAAAGHLINVGFGETFLPFIVGHGSFELTAIVLSGAAGLMLGHALIAPGAYRRSEALRLASRRAVLIVIGSGMMLLVAAFIEAFWSSISAVAPLVKYIVGAGLWLFVCVYLVGAGRGSGPQPFGASR